LKFAYVLTKNSNNVCTFLLQDVILAYK